MLILVTYQQEVCHGSVYKDGFLNNLQEITLIRPLIYVMDRFLKKGNIIFLFISLIKFLQNC